METVPPLGFTAGPLVGGALGAAGLLRLALAIDALSFLVVGVTALVLRGAAAAGGRQPRRAGARPRRIRHSRFASDLAIALGGAVAALAVFSLAAKRDATRLSGQPHIYPWSGSGDEVAKLVVEPVAAVGRAIGGQRVDDLAP